MPPARASVSAAWCSPARCTRKDIDAAFDVTDGKNVIRVTYRGILPDLFREGQGVVTEGTLIDGTSFRADTVLAKHDENYMPKEVADALKKQGHWKDDYGKKPGAGRRRRGRRNDRGDRPLRAGAGAGAGARPGDAADDRRAHAAIAR